MATVKFNLEADEAKAVQSFLRVLDAQNKVENKQRKVNSVSDDFGKSIGTWAAGFVSASGAINLATKALQYQNAELERASGRLRGSEFSLASLSQLAGGDPGQMRRMVDAAKKTSVEAGIDLNQAAKLQFNLESLGIANQRGLFASLTGTVEDPGALAEAAVTLQNAFGKGETGDIRAILNKGLAASSVSKTTLNSLLTNAAQIAPGVSGVGGTDEEALSALAILSKARKSPEQAATEIQALTKVLMKEGLSGKGLFQGIAAIEDKVSGMSDQKKLKFFGDQEGFKAFSTLSQSGMEVMQAWQTTQGGNVIGPGDQVAGAIKARQSIPEILSAENLRKQEQLVAQQGADKFGVGENQQLKLIKQIEQASLQSGESAFTRFLRTSAAETAKFFGAGDQDIIRAAGIAGSGGSTEDTMEFINAVRELTNEIKSMNTNTQTGKISRNAGVTE